MKEGFCECGNELSIFKTRRYLESGEAVCDCGKCGKRVCSSKDWKKRNIKQIEMKGENKK